MTKHQEQETEKYSWCEDLKRLKDVRVVWRCRLIFPHTLGRGSPLRAQCGLFQHLSGNATITDHRPSKTRVALGLEGDKQPSTPSQSTDPSHNLHYWERKYYQLPTNKHLPISRGGIAFFASCERKKTNKTKEKNISDTGRKDEAQFTPVLSALSHFLPCLASLWPLGPALPLIWLLTKQL